MITPEVGKRYVVKHSSGHIPAKFIHSKITGLHRKVTHYVFGNEKTGRLVEIKSRAKILRELVQ